MLSIQFRPVNQDDTRFLLELYTSVRQEEVMSWGWPLETQQSFLQMQWHAQQASYKAQVPHALQTLVIVDQGPVGQYMVDYTSAHLQLVDISILPQARNQGLGSYILTQLQHESTERQTPIQLKVLKGNPASRLYERLGFVYGEANPDSDVYQSMKWQPPTI